MCVCLSHTFLFKLKKNGLELLVRGIGRKEEKNGEFSFLFCRKPLYNCMIESIEMADLTPEAHSHLLKEEIGLNCITCRFLEIF